MKHLTQGTTIGYKRLLRLPKTITDTIIIDIEQSRLEPHLSEVGLFFDQSILSP